MKYFAILLFTSLNIFAQADSIAALRARINADFANPEASPLTDKDRVNFKGLDFFAYDPQFHVRAKLTKISGSKPFEMKTTTDRLPMYREFGTLDFEIGGKKLRLTVYQNMDLALKPGFRDYLFLPFLDLTSGKDSYIGGRYLDLKIPTGDSIDLDFNRAYNPYCAYNYKYSCPLVPPGNDLPVAINAGVKNFHE